MNEPVGIAAEKSIYTFFFSDIEGSTNLLSHLKDQYGKLIADEQALLSSIITKNSGKVIDITGDGFFAIFSSLSNAALAATEIQKEVNKFEWPGDSEVKIRIGLHTGEAKMEKTGPVGFDVHKASRIMSAGNGGQILLSESSRSLLSKFPIEDGTITYLGEYLLKDLPQAEKLYQLSMKGMKNEFPELRATRSNRNNLPKDIVQLVGREDDISRLIGLITDSDNRLVTVTGPGGIGKTSLVLNVCRMLEGKFLDGVFVVMLSSVNDPALIPYLLASAIGITVKEDQYSEMLMNFLHPKRILLFLDNLEQISGASKIIAELLTGAPDLRIIATSRIPLKLAAESEYQLKPLTFPVEGSIVELSHSSEFSAVRMFERCARKYISDFKVTDQNKHFVAAICSRLDGLPLAIELACARLKIFSPGELLKRLESKLDILKSAEIDRPERHKTLRDTIEWSYELLSEDEKKLFSVLSVFRGGFKIESARFVCGDLFDNEFKFIDCFEALVDKSLISSYSDSSLSKFRMLETIRDFAWEKLLASELFRLTADKHTEYFLLFAEEANRHLDGIEIQRWINTMESELDNIRSAMRRSMDEMNAAVSLRFASATLKYSLIRGNLGRTYSTMKEILSIPYDDSVKNLRAKTLNGIGTLVHELSNFSLAIPLIEESIKIYKETNDIEGIIASTINMSWVCIHIAELNEAERLIKELFEMYGEKVDIRSRSLILNGFGWLKFMKGNFLKALEDYNNSIALKEEIGDVRGIAFVKINKARALTLIGDYALALTLFNEAIETLKKLGDNQLTAWGLSNLSFLELQMCNFESAELHLEESRLLMKKVFNNWILAYNSSIEGLISIGSNQNTESGKLLESAVTQFRELGSKWGIAKALYYRSIYERKCGRIDDLKLSMKESVDLTMCFDDRYTQVQLMENLCMTENMNDEENKDLLLGFCASERLRIRTPVNEFENQVNSGLAESYHETGGNAVEHQRALKIFNECCERL